MIILMVLGLLWESGNFTEYELQGVMVGDGVAKLAPYVQQIWTTDAMIIDITLHDNVLYILTSKDTVYYYDGETVHPLFGVTGNPLLIEADTKGRLYLAGMGGMVLKEGKHWLSLPVNMITAITSDPAGNIYIGADRGMIYKITPNGRYEEYFRVNDLQVTALEYAHGALYAGSRPNGLLFKITNKGCGKAIGLWVDEDETSPIKEITAIHVDDGILFSVCSENRGCVVLKQPDELYKIFEINEPIYDIYRYHDTVMVATQSGIWCCTMGGYKALVFQSPSPVHEILYPYVVCGELGQLYRISNHISGEGYIISSPIEFNRIPIWGRLIADMEVPHGTVVKFYTRTGNTPEPDESWTDWLPTDEEGRIRSPPAQFIVWKAVLKGGANRSPVLRKVRLSYTFVNRAPVIETFRFEHDTIVWDISEPDDDSIFAHLYGRLMSESTWFLIKEIHQLQGRFTIPKGRLPDGYYYFKLWVTDSLTQPDGKVTHKVIGPYLLDYTAPEICYTYRDGVYEIKVTDKYSLISHAEYSINLSDWRYIKPEDGIFDDKCETFHIKVGQNAKLAFRVCDEHANCAVKTLQ